MYIHERPDWPELSINHWAKVTIELAEAQRQIGVLEGRLSLLDVDSGAQAQLEVLAEDAIETSLIEGERLSREDVRSSLAKRLGLQSGLLTPREQAVDGIVQIMLDATRNASAPITHERLHGWHAALFPSGHSGRHPITVADYRSGANGPMQVVSGAIGRERVHFEAPSAHRVPAEMDRFLDWLQGPGSGNAILDAGQAHLWFLTIHPYEDGNGRIARAISDAILTRASDQPGQRWYSVSAAISASKKDYYKALESQQRSDTNITPWQAYFIQTVSRAADMAHDTVAQVLRRSAWLATADRLGINDRQRSVARRMLEPDWEGLMSSSKYAGLARCSQDTATRDLKSLVALGLFEPGGKGGRSTSYAPVEHAPQARSQKPSTLPPASSARKWD